MHIWTIEKWKKEIPMSIVQSQSRVIVYADKGIDNDLKTACVQFTEWLKQEYFFPIPICIYLKNETILKAMDGGTAVGTFFEPPSFVASPNMRIAVGDYDELVVSDGRDNAIATILTVIAHEMTHYFQWINGIHLPGIILEWQASRYSRLILSEYSETRDHP